MAFKNPNTHAPSQMKFGPSKKDMAAQQAAMAEASKVTPLPDMNDAAIRKRQADELKSLMKRRGRSKTLLSGRMGDQSETPARRTIAGRV